MLHNNLELSFCAFLHALLSWVLLIRGRITVHYGAGTTWLPKRGSWDPKDPPWIHHWLIIAIVIWKLLSIFSTVVLSLNSNGKAIQSTWSSTITMNLNPCCDRCRFYWCVVGQEIKWRKESLYLLIYLCLYQMSSSWNSFRSHHLLLIAFYLPSKMCKS